ncbi:uncharacterized protein LOC125058565 isoform X3 [Pieris napi]|uniref:uncharacterized protein LOC125058565 isoform X3 n=1 Tax=Pieris napi TaxID=78633 RepID=UPI001FBA35A4|nr:uncharacterized protein LOC125058565 isoform X3 [Pieris napi]
MAVSGDVTLAQDGARLHPYIVALVRWCVSSFWSTASVLIHRLLTAPLPPITAKPAKTRPASSDHLHPVPLVDCVVLHNPPSHTIDVIFVHGLYGSLGNTWRQGEWKANYKMNPDIVPLRRHSNSIPEMTEQNIQITQSDDEDCKDNSFNKKMDDFREKMNDLKYNRDRINNKFINFNEFNDQNDYENRTDFNDMMNNEDRSQLNDDLKNIFKDNVDNVSEFYEDMKKILPNENMFITEKFYNNTLLDQVEIVGNYESQANFVRDLFKSSCESKNDNCECHGECEVGCGCVCDMCYSPCWPKDWIKEDFPGARVISINYTSDPYLWRPLWIKEIKRLRLHERAEQMTSQLLDLGVGQKPIIWVGHSKGGLFIKQIYCDAYDAHLQVTKESVGQNEIDDGTNEFNDRFNDKHSNDISDDALCNTNGIEDETIQNSGNPSKRAGLWRNSAGFMFYSVPHRGSPLADIKTPITARSIELLEICKNCPLLLSLQERWLAATSPFSPAVHSVVETCRTLMSVLWLRIVSIDSADPGRGSLHGVSVDHREICKPTSRHCTLYTELISLMRTALNKS